MHKVTPDHITSLQIGHIFVFGSNRGGRHGKGAALQAYKQFGAVYGVGEGLTGQCYALPTLDGSLRKLTSGELLVSIARFLDAAEDHPELTFLLTKVGCGLAGYSEEYIKSLFRKMILPENILVPEGWEDLRS